jgi:NAD(P)H-flavin reductase
MAEPTQPYARVPVLDAWDETEQLRALTLDLSPHPPERHRPGQALKLRSPDGRESFYALASAPQADRRAELLIKRGAPVADALIGVAGRGAELEVTAPLGRGFPVERADGHDVLLFAAGSGISPVRALVQHLMLARSHYGKVALYYGQRRAAEFAYRREHDQWALAGVEVRLCASRPDGDWQGARGHVQEVARADSFGGVRLERTVAFLCGMKPMVEGVRATLDEAGLPPERTFLNY